MMPHLSSERCWVQHFLEYQHLAKPPSFPWCFGWCDNTLRDIIVSLLSFSCTWNFGFHLGTYIIYIWYIKDNIIKHNNNDHRNKNRNWKIIWYPPPFNQMVQTKLGQILCNSSALFSSFLKKFSCFLVLCLPFGRQLILCSSPALYSSFLTKYSCFLVSYFWCTFFS